MIIICGPNHSGTSRVAEKLLENGFETRNYSKESAPGLNYVTYEDLKFRDICVALNKGKTPDMHYLKKLKGEKLFVKYPSAVLHLDRLIVEIPDDVKVIFCHRRFKDNVASFMRKTGKAKKYVEEHIQKRIDAINKFKGTVLHINYETFENDVDDLLEILNDSRKHSIDSDQGEAFSDGGEKSNRSSRSRKHNAE